MAITQSDNGSIAAGKVNDKLATDIDSYDSGSDWARKVNAVTESNYITDADTGSSFANKIENAEIGGTTIKVCQYNIGHFDMGLSANNGSTPAWTDNTVDGYPSSTSRNYSVQLERWTDRVSGIDADIFGIEEYCARFGRHNCVDVNLVDTGIFDTNDYQFSVGKSAVGGMWINALISKLPLVDEGSGLGDTDLGSIAGGAAYVHVASTTIDGITVKVASTHLNWNHSVQEYYSRQKEIKSLVKMFQNDSHVILFGDFNTRPLEGDEVEGLHDLDPFIYGFTENGVTYQGGFSLANNLDEPKKTCYSTGARPDGPADENKPFVYIDNIIVKGFRISNVTVIDDGRITDHCAVVCDLTLID